MAQKSGPRPACLVALTRLPLAGSSRQIYLRVFFLAVFRLAGAFFLVDRFFAFFFAVFFLIDRLAVFFLVERLAVFFLVERLAVFFLVERLAVFFFGERVFRLAVFLVDAFFFVAMRLAPGTVGPFSTNIFFPWGT